MMLSSGGRRKNGQLLWTPTEISLSNEERVKYPHANGESHCETTPDAPGRKAAVMIITAAISRRRFDKRRSTMSKQREEALQNLKGPIREIQGFSWTELSLADSDVRSKIGCLVNAYQRITLQALNDLSVKQLNELVELTNSICSAFEGMLRHQREGWRPGDEATATVLQAHENTLPIVLGYADRVVATKAMREDAESLLTELRAQQKSVEEAVKAAKTAVTETKESFQKEVDTLLETVSHMGASLHAAFFKREADKHIKFSIGWGIGALAFAALLTGYAFFGDKWISEVKFPAGEEWTPEATYIFARTAITRILGVAIPLYGLFFCAKSYTANCHNVVVNRHRQNALSTYRALMRGNKDKENADIILTQAARFIYAPQDSGYGRGGGMEGGDVSIFESIRRSADLSQKTNK